MVMAIITVVMVVLGFPLAVVAAAHIEDRTSPTAE